MMKRNILAIVIPALLVGTTNAAEIYNKDGNKLDLYGKVDARHFFGKRSSGDDSRVSVGIKGDTKLSDQVTGFGHFEWSTKTSKNEMENENTNRLAYVGLKIADFGSLDYGRNYGVVYDVNSWTGVLPLYGADSMFHGDKYMTSRNLLTYRSSDFFGLVDGLNFALQYQGKNSETNKSSNFHHFKNNGHGFDIAAKYDIGWGVTLGAGYIKTDRHLTKSEQANSGAIGNNADGWNAGIKYNDNNLYLAAMYGETSNMTRFGEIVEGIDRSKIANKTTNFEIVGQYLFNEIGLKPSIAYIQSKGSKLNDDGYSQQNLVKYVSLGAFYYFNKNLTAVVDYKINLVNNNDFTQKYGISSDNLIGLGLVYQF
ncbi:Outer membrane porin protein OmpD precursor [Candidatus Arsenophonus lipoptenae]|uniref:Outer membrane porin protein OmpD n=1 Tax=Candidatus Arsenophonus lipoptenae TaxID=634113 RepID=A0A109QE83_9GAMM|nr:porin [Candidatus Arsenophonus lipoptenae]AMA65114.1 Outer membrane porin protein OmpD precursor [Candidatus Arsenophonus lipoptenae]